jgi:4'-phosphopantetheinyl transferase EntD
MAVTFPEFESLALLFEGSAVVAAVPEAIDAAIFGDELTAVEGVAPGRRIQFIAGRTCARQALQRLDVPPTIIGRAESGAPLWPPSWVGSIAHCKGCAVAVAGPAARWLGFGIDVEPAEPLPEDAASIALTADERRQLEAMPDGYARWSRALFCAKECVHKLLNPLSGAWLEFDEVSIELPIAFDRPTIAFQVRPLSAQARAACDGLQLRGQLAFSRGYRVALLAAAR